MTLVFSTPILVTGLANLIAFKEQNLGTALPCVNLGWQGGGIAKFKSDVAFPFGLEGGHIDNDAATGVGAFAQTNGEDIARDSEIFQGASQRKAVGRDDANIRVDVDKAFFVKVLGVDHRAVNIGEHLEFRGTANVVAIAAGAIAHNFFASSVLTHLPRFKGLDHAVLLRHTADPFVAFDAHRSVFPTVIEFEASL